MNRREAIAALLALAGAPRAHSQAPAGPPRIALVDTAAATAEIAEGRHPLWGNLLGELRRLGYVEGQNIALERWSGGGAGTAAGYSALARKVVASRPRLIVVRSRTALSPIAAETRNIPIVAVGTIPAELRASFARPGRNVTGIHVSFDAQQLYGKQVEVLGNVLKPGARIAWLGPKVAWESIVGEAVRKGATDAGVVLLPVFVANPVNKPAIRRAFAEIAQSRFDGVLISPATELFPYRDSVAELAAAQKLPSLGNGRYWAEAGALLSYGADLDHMWRRAAHYVDKILKGADPAVIPIEQPTKVELVINLETARSLGIAIPQSMLLRADRVIE
jgi:putative ABC transport system substrate-binding protein